jgi:hypothetical protein
MVKMTNSNHKLDETGPRSSSSTPSSDLAETVPIERETLTLLLAHRGSTSVSINSLTVHLMKHMSSSP